MTATWKVENLERDADDVVKVVHWRVGSQYGSTKIDRDGDIVPFEELTPETVISWVKHKLGDDAVANLENAAEPAVSFSGTPDSWIQPMPTVTE